MPINRIHFTRNFRKQFKKLPKRIKKKAVKNEKVFKENPFDPRLETHKLHGKEKETWAFSITNDYRIKFLFLDDGSVLFLEVGTHDIYK